MTATSEILGAFLELTTIAPGFATSVFADRVYTNWNVAGKEMERLHVVWIRPALLCSALWNLGTTAIAVTVSLIAAGIFRAQKYRLDYDYMWNVTLKLIKNVVYSWTAIIQPTILDEKIGESSSS